MKKQLPSTARFGLRAASVTLTVALIAGACGSSPDDAAATEPTVSEDVTATAETAAAETTETAVTEPAEATLSVSCEEIAAAFQTKGSANADLPDPEVNASCEGDSVVITSNQIPDFPYIETSPGLPEASAQEFTIPATPIVADDTTPVAALGAIAVAINGIPIYGATEGTGGDVMSLGGGFTECGGHNGPTGYHYHTFDVTGSDVCLYSEVEAQESLVLFGYAFDGYPIYGGIFQYESSYELTDDSLFATDTWGAHTYVEGSGDLDECNGRIDENGDYAYYATETFPYTVGCYRGVVEASAGGGGAGGGAGPPPDREGPGGEGGPDGAGPPPTDGEGPATDDTESDS